MKCTRYAVASTVVLALVSSLGGQAADSFASRLSGERQIIHVLNRLAYGPRPQDVAVVRRLGVDAWIHQQLHPEHTPDNPVLRARLGALESLSLQTWQLQEKYAVPPVTSPPTPLVKLLTSSEIATLMSGTVAERAALLAAVTGDMRRRLLLVVPAQGLDALPEAQVEAFNVRQSDTAERAAAQRKSRPPLTDLLTPPQQTILMRGTDEDKLTLLRSLDPEKRRHVLRQVPPAATPLEFRRQAIALSQPAQLPLAELIDAKLYRALYSQRQLEEVLVDFWMNHFNVFSGKGPVRQFLPSYERDAIRPHVLGHFRDMLTATARHPAMLFYLDNWLSRAPRDETQSVATTAAPAGLNENYAREIMELHTLGVDSGYTQGDVIAVARAFTGWTIHEPNRYGEFFFNPAMHDREEKRVLGHVLPRGSGEDDGLKVIEILAQHPSTARFISIKLAQRFVADTPPPALVTRMADTFRRTDGDLRAVMRTMLLSPEFLSEGSWRSKVKSPLELVVSALRTRDADVTDWSAVTLRISDLGQPLYAYPEPTGYPNTSEVWASASDLLGRLNFAAELTSGAIWGVRLETVGLPSEVRPAAARLMLPPSRTLTALDDRLPRPRSAADVMALLIASPDFQRK